MEFDPKDRPLIHSLKHGSQRSINSRRQSETINAPCYRSHLFPILLVGSFSEVAHARAHEIRASLTAHSLSRTFGCNRERHAAVAVAVLHPYGFCVDPQGKRNGSKRGAAKKPFDHKLSRSISGLANPCSTCGRKWHFGLISTVA
jgi:hypothetical protein